MTFLKRQLKKLTTADYGLALALCFGVVLLCFWGQDIGFGQQQTYFPFASLAGKLWLSLLAFLAWLSFVVIKQTISYHRAKKIKSALLQKVTQQKNDQVQTLKQDMNTALEGLENASGKAALVNLPWLMVLGSSGEGKTLLVANSGLTFPHEHWLNSEDLDDIDSTLNFKLWLSQQAVLIDTAGRYVDQVQQPEADQAEWLTLLKMIRRYRHKKPVGGLLVVISVEKLSMDQRDKLSHKANQIRQKITDVYQEFGQRVPVYLVVTKCDKLEGFRSFYKDLNTSEELGRSFGIEFDPQDVSSDNIKRSFKEKFNQLLFRLRNKGLHRMSEARYEDRVRAQCFPEAFSTLLEPLDFFIRQACVAQVGAEGFDLKGLYFTSARQEQSTSAQLIEALGAELGIAGQLEEEPVLKNKGFFIHQPFIQKMIPVCDYVAVSRRWASWKQWSSLGSHGVSAAVVILSFVFWTLSYQNNRTFISQAQAQLNDLGPLAISTTDNEMANPEKILDRLDALHAIEAHSRQTDRNAPLTYKFGLYSIDDVSQALRGNYNQSLSDLLPALLGHWLTNQLISENLPVADRYETIRLLLGLSPDAFGQSIEKQFSQRALKEKYHSDLLTWVDGFAISNHMPLERAKLLRTHVSNYLKTSWPSHHVVLNLDVQRINAIRKQIAATDFQHLAFQLFHNAFEPRFQPVALSEVSHFTGCFKEAMIAEPYALSPLHVKGIYTKEAITELLVKEKLDDYIKTLNQEYWVIKDTPYRHDLNSIIRQVKREYARDYQSAWGKTLSRLVINTFDDASGASSIARACAHEDSPIVSILRHVKYHTYFSETKDPADKAIEQGFKAAAKKNKFIKGASAFLGSDQSTELMITHHIEKPFRDLNQLMTGNGQEGPIGDVLNAIDQLAVRPYYEVGELPIVETPEARMQKLKDIVSLADSQPEPVRRWLHEFSHHQAKVVSKVNRKGQIEDIKNQWNKSLLLQCHDSVANRYPFDKNSISDIPFSTFQALFGTGQGFDTFFTAQLHDHVDVRGYVSPASGRPLYWTKAASQYQQQISDKFLRTFTYAARIKQAFLPEPLPITFQPLSLTPTDKKFELIIDGRSISYAHGPTDRPEVQQSVVWPPKNGVESSVEVVFTGPNGPLPRKRYRGQWALFRALDQAQLLEGSGCQNRYTCNEFLKFKFVEGDHYAVIGVRFGNHLNPYSSLVRRALRNFSCETL